LHGVPIAVKDLCNTAGVATAAGMPIHRNHVPVKDATVVARLRAAGAVILGKLQMTEGAYGLHHPSIDPPVNPWNAAYWPGVSSSGSGVATAAGLCFASLGSDTGGSIRFPATMNGLTGLKPTWSRVSRAGVFPLAESLDHVGPMCRSALDAALVLGAIAGPDDDDPTASSHPVPDYATSIGAGGVKRKRLGVPTNLIGMDADSQRAFEAAAAALGSAGSLLVDVELPPFDEVSAVELARLQLMRARVKGEIDRLLATVDLLLVPVMGVAAPSLAGMKAAGRTPQTIAARLRYTAPFDLSGHPTLTLPAGMTADGVPVGVQIVGRAFDEAAILAAGHAFQQASDWHLKRPPL
jgi:amidase